MNARDYTRMQSHKSPEQLEREIDQQRVHIAGIIEALEHRLSPGDVVERALRLGKDGGREFASNLGETVRANPVPSLLTAAGLVWLYAGRDKRAVDSYPATDTASETEAKAATWGTPHLGERMRNVRQGASGKLGAARHRAADSAHGAVDSARHQAQRANAGFHHMLDDNPMAVGAMGIAVGALLGAVLPTTRKEDELMGETRDRLTDEARHLARAGREKVAESAREVTGPAGGDGGLHHSQPGTPSAGSITPADGPV